MHAAVAHPLPLASVGATSAASLRAAWIAVVLGVVFLAGTGFSTVSAVHNAAHDARHAAGFPCH